MFRVIFGPEKDEVRHVGYYLNCTLHTGHQISCFMVTAKSCKVATRTAERKPVEHFAGFLTST